MGSIEESPQNGMLPVLRPGGTMQVEGVRSQLHMAVDFVVNYFENVETLPVLPVVRPGYLKDMLPVIPPTHGASFDTAIGEVYDAVLPGMTHWASPNFFAFFPATNSAAAIAGDLIASALNPVAFTWQAAPAVTEMEALATDWLARLLHLPDAFLNSGQAGKGGGGVLLATTTEAVICTLVTARDRAAAAAGGDIGRLVAYASDQTHSMFSKACRIAGISKANIRIIEAGASTHFALDPAQLRLAMEADVAAGLVPTYVCATVGTTSTNAVDPVGGIARVAAEFGAWIHVDAAYAGSACLCPELRYHLAGVELADSLSVSPHKWLMTGLDCTCMWVRDSASISSALETRPEYLSNGATDSGAVVDLKDFQIGTGRRFRGLRLWMVMRTYGADGLRDHIRSDVAMAALFEKLVRSDARFEVVVPRHFALVCFRLVPRGEMSEEDAAAENRKLVDLVNGTGRAYVAHTVVSGKFVIRFAVGSTLTEEHHVRDTWQLFVGLADKLGIF